LAVLARPLSGERDCNFLLSTADGRQFVLKLFDLGADATGAESLTRVLAHLNEQDPELPVPKLFAAQQGSELVTFRRDAGHFAACLLIYLPGRLLTDNPGPELLFELGTQLARIDRALRGYFHETLSRVLAWDVRNLPALLGHSQYLPQSAVRRAVEEAAMHLHTLLPKLRGFRSQAIHGDCHGHNVLIDDAATRIVGILDFGDMLHAPLIFEPAVAMAELMLDGVAASDVGRILSGYTRVQALEPQEVESVLDLVTARIATTLLLHGWRQQHDAEGASLLESHARRASELLPELLASRRALSDAWHIEAGTSAAGAKTVSLPRRRALMGAGAELFYRTPLHLVRGEGVWLFDPAGAKYLDVYNNVPHVGHSHPHVARAIAAQAAQLSTHTRYLHDDILRYAEALTLRLPPHLNTCIFVNSGSEANDVAWRIAKMVSGERGALVMSNAYHGITDAVGALTPGAGEPQDPWVATISATAADAGAEAQAAIDTLKSRGFKPAAWYLDSGITSSGIYDPPPEWAAAIEAKVRAAGGLIVADEVQYGLGRSGSHFFGFDRRGLKPDVVTLGKPVGNGFPIGVVIATREVVETFQAKYGFFSTFGGNAVAASAGLAVLEVIEREGLQQNAEATGAYLRERLNELAGRHAALGEARGHGLLLGVPVNGRDPAQAKRRAADLVNIMAAEHRVLIGTEGPNSSVLKLRPPLPFNREHADLLVRALDAAVLSGR
jgi:4-aminobutyrate aminotransferase-like enzyme/Ser/Thr protein kinase RdoA (MazF antagonist)